VLLDFCYTCCNVYLCSTCIRVMSPVCRYHARCHNSLSPTACSTPRPQSLPAAVQLATIAHVVNRRQAPSAGVNQRQALSVRRSNRALGSRGLTRRRSAFAAGPAGSPLPPRVPRKSTTYIIGNIYRLK